MMTAISCLMPRSRTIATSPTISARYSALPRFAGFLGTITKPFRTEPIHPGLPGLPAVEDRAGDRADAAEDQAGVDQDQDVGREIGRKDVVLLGGEQRPGQRADHRREAER